MSLAIALFLLLGISVSTHDVVELGIPVAIVVVLWSVFLYEMSQPLIRGEW